MNQSLKAMMVAGMVAIGVPLLTGAANAQTVPPNSAWNLVNPSVCYSSTDNASQPFVYLASKNSTGGLAFQAVVLDESVHSVLLKYCSDGTQFYALWNGSSVFSVNGVALSVFSEIEVWPGL
jgi:hypothetical protein